MGRRISTWPLIRISQFFLPVKNWINLAPALFTFLPVTLTMGAMRIALISDIHGNLPALEAVLADIRTAVVDEIICLGDIANVGPHPAECLDLVRSLNCVTLQGNHELYLLGRIEDPGWQTCPTWSPVRWTQAQLSQTHLHYMANLPYDYTLPANGRSGATFVHASPHSQYHGFQAEMVDTAVAGLMDGLDNTTLFCAHTHRPLYRQWSQSWLVNIGSVGMPLDGTPEAKYIIATRSKHQWHLEFRAVSYNTVHLMAEFDRTGLQEAGGLITAMFRFQMATGQPVAWRFIRDLREKAAALNTAVGDIYTQTPIPTFLEPYL